MRLIDADALFESIRFDREAAKVHPQEMCERLGLFCDYAEAVVKEAPTIDAEPVRHGRWIYRVYHFGDEYYTCSACGEDWFIPDGTPAENHMHFCPVCGAKMDWEVQEDG